MVTSSETGGGSDSDTWYSRALPILEVIRDTEGTDAADLLSIGDLADRAGVEPMATVVEVERLIAGGFISGTLAKRMTGGDVRPWFINGARLAPDGARLVGVWPSRDPYEALMALLERRIDEAPDEDSRSRLRKVRDGFARMAGDVGTNVVANIIVEVAKGGV